MTGAKLLKITKTAFDKYKNRLEGFMWNGGSDTRSAIMYAPYGVDSNPVKGTVCVYMRTEMDGKEVCIGQMIIDRKAQQGESRYYATDANGNFKFNIWLRTDGTALIGDSDTPSEYTNYATKYNEAKQELDKLKSTLNDLIQKWNAFCSSYTPGSPSTVGTPPTLSTSTVQANSSNFSLIKHEKIKYND